MTDLTAGTGGTPTPNEPGKKPRQTYRQEWRTYDEAQAHELRDFYRLNARLCRTIPAELSLQQPRGRHRVPLADLSFVAIMKAYLGLPGRVLGSPRFDESFVLELYNAEHISRPMCWNSVGNFLRNGHTTEVLQYLVQASALPLIPVEKGDIAFDSTVINGPVLVKIGDPHYPGQTSHKVMKLHLATGIRSNIVTACAIESPGAGEAPLFPGLLYQTAKAFPIKNAYGDAAYRSYRNYEIVNAMGATGYLAFHDDDTGAEGGIFGEMYHWAMAHREEFRAMYFKRNNVEATISAIKRVIASGVRHKTEALRNRGHVSLRNEILSMVIAHNLRVVIKHIYKVGIDANFLPGPPRDPFRPQ